MGLIVYWLIWILIIWSVGIYTLWLSKIIKLLLGNYIVAALIFALSKIIDTVIKNINTVGVETTLGIKNAALADILGFGKWPLLLIYLVLLFLVYKISKVSIIYARWFLVQKTIKIIYAPLTALSIFFTLWLMISTMGILSSATIEAISSSNWYLNFVLQNIWIWIFLHSIIVLLITSRINVLWFKNKDPLSDSILP